MLIPARSPLPVVAPPDPFDDEVVAVLAEPLAHDATQPPSSALRDRLMGRLAASVAASRPMATTRIAGRPRERLARGVTAVTLYEHDPARPLRPGEAHRARLVTIEGGASWEGPGAGLHREWLVLRGAATLGAEALGERDYHADPADSPGAMLVSSSGAVVFLREAIVPAAAGDAPFTVRDAEAGWPEFAPGIQRRVLWQREGQAALLYYAQPGAFVPRHSHGHDEECLMVQGELFLDDELLRAGDFQVAPAGTGHAITATDTGVVIYAHGDIDLRFGE